MPSRMSSAPVVEGQEPPHSSATTAAAESPQQESSSTPGSTLVVRAKSKRSAFANAKRSITKGPRLLGRRIKHFLTDDLYIDVNYKKAPPSIVSKELAVLDVLAVYHRWLRGVQALLAIAIFLLSLVSIDNTALLVNSTIFILSQATILVICKTYEVKAQFSGVTNVLFEGRNIFTSPYFIQMVVEIIIWNIQTPPYVVYWKPLFDCLNYFVFLRLYSVVLYLNNAIYVYSTFCRAMSAISSLPLSTPFLVRTGMLYHRLRVTVSVVLFSWLTVGAFYARAEGIGVGEALWFSFQSLTTLGYGDVTASTLAGRTVTVLAGLASYVMMALLIIALHTFLQASERSHNMQVLMTCHDLVSSLRSRSAYVIQLAWRLHKARKVGPHAPSLKAKAYTLAVSWTLTHMIAARRRTRQHLDDAERSFHEAHLHPLTGLSAYQYNAYVQATHQAARTLQRVKDVDRVYLALRHRDGPASSLTRRDIESILMLPGDAPDSAAATLLPESVGDVTACVTVAEVAQWRDRVVQLEQKCARLAEVIDMLSAAGDAHAPSTAASHT